ncbi:glycoside hydrolase superfamily [Aspergillus leporis]|uniref:Glycoside hydrolase superfamily n=1 Tax=Aspergillus leporis TaxID=41062 RepID=A0A5N5WZ95_9EURO|nr:glycoside hydrolase superfamily [Aspergillus leporis]
MHLGTFIYLVTGSLVTLLLKGAAGLQNDSATYPELYVLYFESTPVFQNVTGKTANPLLRVLHGAAIDHPLKKRVDNGLPIGTCAPGTPCSNGACCSKVAMPFKLGCAGSLLINADPMNASQIAMLRQSAASMHRQGLRNVQSTFAAPSLASVALSRSFVATDARQDLVDVVPQKHHRVADRVQRNERSVIMRGSMVPLREFFTFMYTYMNLFLRAATRACDKRLPSDLDVSGLTHINFVFAYFHPMTFEVLPMSGEDTALYPQFTALKAKKPSLKAWISIGGWAFNDATNSPNTQTAFSEMAGSAASRAKFTQSILSFMSTWGFDGVDFDWEYPGADDRGGVKTDTGNFVLLLKDAPKRP